MVGIPFDGIGTFVVFLVGVPALIVQLMTPEIRSVVLKRRKQLIWFLLETIFPLFIAIAVVVWGMLNHLSLPKDTEWVYLCLGSLQTGEVHVQTIWAIALAVLTVVAIYMALWVPYRFGQRETVIGNLKKEIVGGLDQRGQLTERSLEDLIEVGKQSEPGQDKEFVLRALHDLAIKTCEHPKYRGDSLETLIHGVVDILTSNKQRGSSEDFHTAVQILQDIMARAGNTKSDGLSQVDQVQSVHALSALSQAMLIDSDGTDAIQNTLRNCVQSLVSLARQREQYVTEVSQALFEVGIKAIEKNQMFLAIAAAAEMFALVEKPATVKEESVADALGLAAHFWVSGPTARKYVESKLMQLQVELKPGLPEALEQAQRHCAERTYFQTADNLRQMVEDLFPPQKARGQPQGLSPT